MLKSKDVFTPGRFPVHTYVDDHLVEKKRQLEETLDAGAMLISVSGPSKSGKTVFIEQCLGRSTLIQVTGAGVSCPEEIWFRVFDIIGTPISKTNASTNSKTRTVGGSGSLSGNAVIAKGEASLSAESSGTEETAKTEEFRFDPLQLVIRELANTGLVIFVDDFHYIPRKVQIELAKQMKEAIRNDVRIICASVPYHADDVIRSNPDLRGRVFSMDFEYWGDTVLKKIALKGFPELNILVDDSMIENLVIEAAGSPQLMQYLCLNSCYEIGVFEAPAITTPIPGDVETLNRICRKTVLSTDYGSIVEMMKDGPKSRGSDRKVYATKYGWEGDVYRLLVKAISLDPPQLTFRYNSLFERVVGICEKGGPSGSSITSACSHSAKIVNDSAGERIVEWDSETDVFDIRDPYFLFYLRWSDTTG